MKVDDGAVAGQMLSLTMMTTIWSVKRATRRLLDYNRYIGVWSINGGDQRANFPYVFYGVR